MVDLQFSKMLLLGMVESSLYQGSIYFNCNPNFAVSLSYNMLKGAQPLVIVYRIYYKLMKTTLEPQPLMERLKDKTLLLQTSTKNSNTRVPTQINWNEINLPNR